MKEDSLYFGVFLKVVYNCIWKMTHLCIKLRKLKAVFLLTFLRERETIKNVWLAMKM